MLRSVLKTALCSLFFSLALAELGAAQNSAARMDKVVQSYVDAKQFMGSVLVARGETVLFGKAYYPDAPDASSIVNRAAMRK
jgi:hypothetical protein